MVGRTLPPTPLANHALGMLLAATKAVDVNSLSVFDDELVAMPDETDSLRRKDSVSVSSEQGSSPVELRIEQHHSAVVEVDDNHSVVDIDG